ncbi:hypothetical protein PoB_003321900 [Plakobranchus ocellatus]|uniref:Uncharacterized protein n=1 Tax=Plakobranchus ocellatus TaxID=259542 RepID=A0AAV4AJW9_9GAST|nr:hypothetical protein PoB_003321900 [Plakobranchus ocellatus]
MQDTSLIWKIVMVLQIIGLILGLIGFGAPNHVEGEGVYDEYYIGLWKTCFKDCDDTHDILDGLRKDSTWLDASRTMMGIACGAELLVIILCSLAALTTLTQFMGLLTAAVAFLSSIIGLIGATVFQVEAKNLFKTLTRDSLDSEPGWAFFLFLTAQLAYIGCAVLHICDSRYRSR